MNCKKHPDVPVIVRSSGSVNGGSIRWGCAVCNSLKMDELRDALRELLPRGWRDGTMDHMPGVKAARLALEVSKGN